MELIFFKKSDFSNFLLEHESRKLGGPGRSAPSHPCSCNAVDFKLHCLCLSPAYSRHCQCLSKLIMHFFAALLPPVPTYSYVWMLFCHPRWTFCSSGTCAFGLSIADGSSRLNSTCQPARCIVPVPDEGSPFVQSTVQWDDYQSKSLVLCPVALHACCFRPNRHGRPGIETLKAIGFGPKLLGVNLEQFNLSSSLCHLPAAQLLCVAAVLTSSRL